MTTGFSKYPELYGSTRWRKICSIHLGLNPLCDPCLLSGKETPATIVHHKIPHKGDPKLFWDTENLESVCASCHSGIKRMEDLHGFSQACDENGNPTDPNHPWNLKR